MGSRASRHAASFQARSNSKKGCSIIGSKSSFSLQLLGFALIDGSQVALLSGVSFAAGAFVADEREEEAKARSKYDEEEKAKK
jgi:predicted Kef-type K+ transport protein